MEIRQSNSGLVLLQNCVAKFLNRLKTRRTFVYAGNGLPVDVITRTWEWQFV